MVDLAVSRCGLAVPAIATMHSALANEPLSVVNRLVQSMEHVASERQYPAAPVSADGVIISVAQPVERQLRYRVDA